MVGKEVMLYLKNGYCEPVVCQDFKIGMDDGKAAMLFRLNAIDVYVVPLWKVHHFEVNYVWIFSPDEPFLPPMDPDIAV